MPLKITVKKILLHCGVFLVNSAASVRTSFLTEVKANMYPNAIPHLSKHLVYFLRIFNKEYKEEEEHWTACTVSTLKISSSDSTGHKNILELKEAGPASFPPPLQKYKSSSAINSFCFVVFLQIVGISHLEVEGADVDIASGLPLQVLVVRHHHVSVLRQVTVHLQHVCALLHCAADDPEQKRKNIHVVSSSHA